MNLLKTSIAAIAVLTCTRTTWAEKATADITGTKENSAITGALNFEDVKEGLKISGSIENVNPGEHGFHIHEFGLCSDEGKNAGGHYNPDQHQHGHALKNKKGQAHPGDMGNLTFNDQGTARIDLVLPGVSLSGGKYNVAGRAVILHEKKDDFSQPTGNAGGRIGCGPILLSGK